MEFTLKTDLSKISEVFKERIRKVTLNEINRVGLEIVTAARQKQGHEVGGFNDITGVLRSSIGYIVLYDGVQIYSDFQGVPEGVSDGKNLAEQTAESYPKGYVLIMVAGANYATYVEDRGYDVITGSAILLAGKLLREAGL